jgi:hypothetical protein
LAAGGIDAVEDLADAPRFLHGGVLQELGPAMLAKQALRIWVVSVDLKKDLSTRLRRNA